jgi:2-(1,2-epoxy-1,2-dihydrophenyl)acetyl-CoA isomerase
MPMSNYETIRFEAADGIGRLTLARPERMNAMTNRMVIETHRCLTEVAGRADVRVLVLSGEGRGFCPGADLKHFAAGESDDTTEPVHFQVPLLLHRMPQITVAAINGMCAGAGFGWACACDLRFAARSATFSSAFLNVASAGDMAGPWTLPRLVGAAKARELYFLPEKFLAEDALAMGLVSAVFEDDAFAERIGGIAGRLGAASPHALRTMKRNFIDAERMDLETYIQTETERHMQVMAHDDAREAFRAFVEKRPPRFGARHPSNDTSN